MKRIFVGLLAAVLLAGCAGTPENTLVAQKDVERLLEKAREIPDGNSLADIAKAAPERYTWSGSAYDGRVTVAVDAAVTLPETAAMATWQVTAGGFTQTQVDAMVAYLYGGRPLYDVPNDCVPVLRGDLQREIGELEAILAAGPTDPRWLRWGAVYDEVDGSGSHVPEEMVRIELEGALEVRRQEIETAPEQVSDVLPVSSGRLSEDGGGNSALLVMDEAQNLLSVGSQDKTSTWVSGVEYALHRGTVYSLNNARPAEAVPGYPEARALADGFFAACEGEMAPLGAWQVDDGVPEDGLVFTLRGSLNYPCVPREATGTALVFYYTSAAGGQPVAFDPDGGNTGAADKTSTEFEAMWPYEFAYVVVAEGEICEVYWRAPLTGREQVSGDTGLISFDEAKTVFEEMITVPYEGNLAMMDAAGGTEGSYELQVDAVSMALLRTRSAGGERTGILTPAWVFYGAIGGNGIQAAIESPFPRIVFAVNAIDGTVIDVARGY